MKLLAKCICALFFVLSSLTANANVEPTVSVRSQKNNAISLHLKNIENETFRIKLSDRKGFVLFSEKVQNQADYLKFFSLKNLPVGDYQLIIEGEGLITTQPISVNKQKVIVDMANQNIISKKVNSNEVSTTSQAINNKIKWIQEEKSF